jgi:hypothetical protein
VGACIFVCLTADKCFTGLAATVFLSGSGTVVQGSPVDLNCHSDSRQPINTCRFTVPGFPDELRIYESSSSNYKFIGQDLFKGRCVLQLFSVFRNNSGKVKCTLLVNDWTEQLSQTDLTVVHPIEKLGISFFWNGHNFKYEENDMMEFTCAAEGGYPAPNLTLYLGTG